MRTVRPGRWSLFPDQSTDSSWLPRCRKGGAGKRFYVTRDILKPQVKRARLLRIQQEAEKKEHHKDQRKRQAGYRHLVLPEEDVEAKLELSAGETPHGLKRKRDPFELSSRDVERLEGRSIKKVRVMTSQVVVFRYQGLVPYMNARIRGC